MCAHMEYFKKINVDSICGKVLIAAAGLYEIMIVFALLVYDESRP